MSNDTALISLNGVKKVFLTDEIETHALSDVHLEIEQGEFVSVEGPSGCGKSTLLSILGLLDTPTEGHYTLNEQSVAGLAANERARIRNLEIGFIFQAFNLIPDLNIADNVDVPLRYRGFSGAERRRRIDESLELVGLTSRRDHLPSQLSGGQQQRVAIARALAGDPALLLADEPTGNLDSLMARQVMDLLEEINARGTTIIMVTHDPELARRAARNVHLLDGQVSDFQPLEPPPAEAEDDTVRSVA